MFMSRLSWLRSGRWWLGLVLVAAIGGCASCHGLHAKAFQSSKARSKEAAQPPSSKSTQPAGHPGEETQEMPSSPPNFDEVPLGSDEENACTPKEPEDINWTGILIQSPREVELGEGANLPLCGRLQLPASDGAPMKLVALRAGADEPLDGVIYVSSGDLEDGPPDGPPLSPEDLAGLLVGGVFNHDAFVFVPQMAVPGTWKVSIQVGKWTSNEVTVELVARK